MKWELQQPIAGQHHDVWKCGGDLCGALARTLVRESHDADFHPEHDLMTEVANIPPFCSTCRKPVLFSEVFGIHHVPEGDSTKIIPNPDHPASMAIWSEQFDDLQARQRDEYYRREMAAR